MTCLAIRIRFCTHELPLLQEIEHVAIIALIDDSFTGHKLSKCKCRSQLGQLILCKILENIDLEWKALGHGTDEVSWHTHPHPQLFLVGAAAQLH